MQTKNRFQSIVCSCTRARVVAVRTLDSSINNLEGFILCSCGKISQSEISIVGTIQVSMQHHVLIKSTSTEYLFPANQTGKEISTFTVLSLILSSVHTRCNQIDKISSIYTANFLGCL